METHVLATCALLNVRKIIYQCYTLSRTAVNLSYKILGGDPTNPDAPPIFLFHGLLERKKHWEFLGKTILSVIKRSVVVVDLRNHGDSPHVNSNKYEDMVEDILQLFDKLQVKKASVIGNSVGGRACMSLALMAPKKVAGLLVVDISPVSSAKHFTDFYAKVLLTMNEIDFKGRTKKKKAKKTAKRKLKQIIHDDDILNAVLDNVGRSNAGLGWTCNLEILIQHFKYIVTFPTNMKKRKYYGPTLFLGGQLSDYIPPDDLNSIREYFPRAVIKYITGARTNPHIGDPRSFLEKSLPFLKKHHL